MYQAISNGLCWNAAAAEPHNTAVGILACSPRLAIAIVMHLCFSFVVCKNDKGT